MKIIALHNGHDSSITALEDGIILGHWELERVLNIKHFCGIDDYHENVIAGVLYDHVLPKLGWKVEDIEQVVFAGKSEWEDTEFFTFVPQYNNFCKLQPYATGNVELRGGYTVPCVSVLHHVNHMAYAYYTSPFSEALAFSYDGVGDDTSSMAGWGKGCHLEVTHIFSELPDRNNGIGLCYAYLGRLFPFLGRDVLATAGKAMGLSSYGYQYDNNGNSRIYNLCMDMITEWMPEPSKYHSKFKALIPGIDFNDPMNRGCQDLMATIQRCLEDYLCETIDFLQLELSAQPINTENLVMAGGCALNVQANTRLLKDGIIEKLYVPPATSDCGVSIGAALYVWHHIMRNEFQGMNWHDPYLGDEVYGAPPKWAPHITRNYTPCDVKRDEFIVQCGKDYPTLYVHPCRSEAEMITKTAGILAYGAIVAWAQGRCEIGPRALGNRSIICSAAPTQDDWLDVWREGKGTFKETINNAIKHREFWRPFAPLGLVEDSYKFFEIDHEQPYMLEAPMVKEWWNIDTPDIKPLWYKIAATVHVDGTARIQTVTEENNKLMHDLLQEYKSHSGVGVLLNTSLNDAGIPINNRLEDILNLLRDTEVDYAVVGNWIFSKKDK